MPGKALLAALFLILAAPRLVYGQITLQSPSGNLSVPLDLEDSLRFALQAEGQILFREVTLIMAAGERQAGAGPELVRQQVEYKEETIETGYPSNVGHFWQSATYKRLAFCRLPIANCLLESSLSGMALWECMGLIFKSPPMAGWMCAHSSGFLRHWLKRAGRLLPPATSSSANSSNAAPKGPSRMSFRRWPDLGLQAISSATGAEAGGSPSHS